MERILPDARRREKAAQRNAGQERDFKEKPNVVRKLQIETPGQGLHEITSQVRTAVRESGCSAGLCTVMILHTSASLLIQENADPSAKRDLERWLNRLVPENDALYTHTVEGPDDMPAHIKAALTATTLSIPIVDGRPALGAWQGIYLWEHRHDGGDRTVLVHVLGDCGTTR